MTPTHHTPPEPGAIRSILAPHMACLGTYRDMLSQDVQLASGILRSRENEMEDAITDWQHSHGQARVARRDAARLAVARVQEWRRRQGEALARLAGYRAGEMAA